MVPTVMDYSLALRISSVFILFVASAFGVVLPLWLSSSNEEQTDESHRKMCESDAFRITRTFAAGIMLGVGFIHLLADGVTKLAQVNTEYPALGYTLATVGTMIVVGFEQVAVMMIGSVNVDSNNVKSSGMTEKNIEADFGMGPSELEVLETHAHNNPGSCDHNHAIKMIAGTDSFNVIVKAYMMEISVAIHSVIIGIALGSLIGAAELGTLKALLIAICFHQFFEGIGLGTVIEGARIQLGLKKILFFALTFAMTVPAGVLIGIAISGDEVPPTYDDSGELILPRVDLHREYTLGCLNSIAAGDNKIMYDLSVSKLLTFVAFDILDCHAIFFN